MKQQALEKIRSLKTASEALSTFWNRYEEATKEPTCDKHNAAFCHDDRFKLFDIKNIFFSAYKGYYGNSGCSTFPCRIPNDADIRKHFIRAINELAPEIFEAMAESMRQEAKKLLSDAEHELARMNDLLEDVRAN